MKIKLPRGRVLDGPLLAGFEQERDRFDGMITRGAAVALTRKAKSEQPRRPGSLRRLRRAAFRPLKVRPCLPAEISTFSPSLIRPERISSASGSCTAFWITRLSGRAP